MVLYRRNGISRPVRRIYCVGVEMKTRGRGKSAVLLKMQSLGTLVGESAFRPMTGESRKPVLVSPDELGVTFIGHSSFLVQIGGRKLLIDPVFAERLIALRRLRRPGVKIKDLPAMDMVLLSHAAHGPSQPAIPAPDCCAQHVK